MTGGRLTVAIDMTFPNRNRGGTGVYASELIEALSHRDEVVVSTVAATGAAGPGSTLRWLLAGARNAVAGTQLVHCPAGIAPWRLGAPFVLTVHDTLANEFRDDHTLEWRTYAEFVLPRRARSAARVIAGSECLRREIVTTLGVPAERVAVTPYGIAPRFSRSSQRRSSTQPVLLFPGAPIRRKNLDVVLDALASAPKTSKLATARLLISGATDNQFPDHVVRIRSLGLQDRVEWMGRLPAEAMPDLLAGCDAVVYPSTHEGFGFPALEAMAAGTPVVASNAPCLPGVLGDGALLVEPTDVRGIIDALEAILTKEPLRRDLITRGRAWAAQYTWDRCAALTIEVYREAASASAI